AARYTVSSLRAAELFRALLQDFRAETVILVPRPLEWNDVPIVIHARTTSAATSAGRRGGEPETRILRQCTTPVESRRDELHCVFVVSQRDVEERQRRRGKVCLRGAVERGRQLRVVEGRMLLFRRGIDDDEFVAALHGTPVPEVIRIADPRGALRHVQRESLKARV